MDFKNRRVSADGITEVEIVESVRFEDTAELRFGIACLKAVTSYLHSSGSTEDAASLIAGCEAARATLEGLAGMGQEFSQGMLRRGQAANRIDFRSRNPEVATTVMYATTIVRNSSEVRAHFPPEDADLLNVFVPETE